MAPPPRLLLLLFCSLPLSLRFIAAPNPGVDPENKLLRQHRVAAASASAAGLHVAAESRRSEPAQPAQPPQDPRADSSQLPGRCPGPGPGTRAVLRLVRLRGIAAVGGRFVSGPFLFLPDLKGSFPEGSGSSLAVFVSVPGGFNRPPPAGSAHRTPSGSLGGAEPVLGRSGWSRRSEDEDEGLKVGVRARTCAPLLRGVSAAPPRWADRVRVRVWVRLWGRRVEPPGEPGLAVSVAVWGANLQQENPAV